VQCRFSSPSRSSEEKRRVTTALCCLPAVCLRVFVCVFVCVHFLFPGDSTGRSVEPLLVQLHANSFLSDHPQLSARG